MPTVVHFEIPADDLERAKRFYQDVFGWKITRWEGLKSENEYWLIDSSTEKEKASISGGIIKRQAPSHMFMNYIGVDSIDGYIEKVKKAGGRVVLPKQVVGGVGAFAAFMDSEGNLVGLHQREKGSRFGTAKEG